MEQLRVVDLKSLKIGAVLNTASGSCSNESVAEMEAILQEYELTPVRIWCSASDELHLAFAEVAKRDLDVLIVLGGDGTIRSAAELCTPEGPLLIPLPGGTMNVLPKALYGTGSWQEILRSVLMAPTVKRISGGEVAGHRFFIAAVCGAPALWTHVREALRARNIGEMIEHGKVALSHMFADKIHYQFNEMHEGDTEALTVTCPLVSSSLESDRDVFEAAVIDVNDAGEVLALATAAAFGQWREAKQVAIVRTRSVTVSSRENIPIILDGETVDVGTEVSIQFLKEAFDVLVPHNEVLS
ncbi:MAG TPA: diacylglycerol kinase family protein [Candidatus Paceibacterota bacterium]|nr:diacylglycerol kinase family protein [Candidatus Paceibacterota bacterium]